MLEDIISLRDVLRSQIKHGLRRQVLDLLGQVLRKALCITMITIPLNLIARMIQLCREIVLS